MPLDPLDIASPVPADICADTAVHVVADRSAGLRSILAGLRAHHEYVVTLITELLIVLSQLFVYRTAAHLFGTTGFSEVALARRSVNLIQPIVLLGLTVALPRYIAFASGRGETLAIKRFFGATLRCMLISLLLALVLIFTFRNWVAFLLFGSSAYQFLVPPIMLMLAGVVLHGTA